MFIAEDLTNVDDAHVCCKIHKAWSHLHSASVQAMPGVAIGPADLALLPLPAQEEGLIWLQMSNEFYKRCSVRLYIVLMLVDTYLGRWEFET